jgi:hypothetical protein
MLEPGARDERLSLRHNQVIRRGAGSSLAAFHLLPT